MAATSRNRSSGSGLPVSNGFHRSISPSGRFCSSPSHSASAFASSSASSFSTRSAPGFFHHQHHHHHHHHHQHQHQHHSHQRSASPTRLNLYGSGIPSSPAVRFSIDRSTSPSRSLAVDQPIVRRKPISAPSSRRTCMCSPTNHPGSFRCSLHKGFGPSPAASGGRAYSSSSSQLSHARRSAMTNSLVRIGTVEGDWVKRALAALIRPSSHQQRRRAAFQPRPSRLSVVSTAVDCES
ncbi:hypothetical protein QJS10_CPB17g02161 [Acorus calamus]|uniref:Serine-rich protein-like protein n=1 Tax=Acorus calamus TaxID=4465 RepID=A0AAV9CVT2_ACOCL|nr:hypothetical protein QJS10_CPB17g02161 [Acorus calamus]